MLFSKLGHGSANRVLSAEGPVFGMVDAMNKRTLCPAVLTVLLILSFAGTLVPRAMAEGVLQVVQVVPGEKETTLFLSGEINPATATCRVSNQEASVVKSGSLADEGARIQTTVLIDVSASVPKAMREKVVAAVDKLIEQKSANEAYRLVAFAQGEHVLCDFTTDRYDLGKAMESIAFDGQWSMIYDAIYNAIPQAEEAGESLPAYSRILVITDGVDETKVGVTMEELFLKLQSERCPVDVLAVNEQSQSTPNKELSGITRISGGRYLSLDPDTSLENLPASLSAENFSYLQVQVPEHLLDGSVRQVDLTLDMETITLDVKFPASFIQAESEPTVPVETPEVPEPEPGPEPEAIPELAFLERYGTVCAIVAAAAVVVLALVLIIALRGKKAKSASDADENKLPAASAHPTEKLKETMPFIDETLYTVKFSAPRHPGQSWTLELAESLLIGRADHCDLRLEDGTVSREHCRIEVRDNALVLVHLGSNTTRINGIKVTDSKPLASGDLLSLGREQLKIDYIQKLDGPETSAATGSSGSGRPTSALFGGGTQ